MVVSSSLQGAVLADKESRGFVAVVNAAVLIGNVVVTTQFYNLIQIVKKLREIINILERGEDFKELLAEKDENYLDPKKEHWQDIFYLIHPSRRQFGDNSITQTFKKASDKKSNISNSNASSPCKEKNVGKTHSAI